ncbi:hypothetical protein [Lysobacter sp. cf310]|uniref:hypothetical protein n=1 Tax=Lysobacter sp. cf310 TaxID=1761790 RepID=UPI0008DFA1FF|nr:hypothetical protein [Lysobacter sp. cf310]SFL18313.1 hypothetical protein SAMN04487938_3524 [Lysobacter sp. cf310]
MRLLVLLSALSMPLVAWWSQRGAFGPDNGTLSDRYPTLLVAAGYAFAIWGPIFLCDALFAFWQSQARREHDATLARIRPVAAAGFALTALWMPVFSRQWFWLALLVIWAALACLGWCALRLSRDPSPLPGQRWLAWLPLSLHAGWLSLAALLNTAQTIVAYRLLPSDDMLAWSLGLYAVAAALLLTLNARMRGNWAYALAALWGLVGVYVQQSRSPLSGAPVAAWIALAIAAVLLAQGLWLLRRTRGAA